MDGSSNQQSIITRLRDVTLREPLIPFAIVGGLLFIIYGYTRPVPRQIIDISPQTVQALVDFEESLRGSKLTDEQRTQVIDSFVDDEVLMREALKQGIERSDLRVRKRLLTVMRSSLDEQVPEPTRAELEAWFRENAAQYSAREVVVIEQVVFSFGNEPENLQQILGQLQSGADHRELGDSFLSGTGTRPATRSDLLSYYGVAYADQVFQLPQGLWHGPFESTQGIHFVRVVERQLRPAPTFEQLEDYLRDEWMFSKRREIQIEKSPSCARTTRLYLPPEMPRSDSATGRSQDLSNH